MSARARYRLAAERLDAEVQRAPRRVRDQWYQGLAVHVANLRAMVQEHIAAGQRPNSSEEER